MFALRNSVALFTIMSCATAHAGIVVGPTMGNDVIGHTNWGIQFTVKEHAWLRSFDYETQGNSGEIELKNITTDTVVFSDSHAAGSTIQYSGLGILLVKGHDYQIYGNRIAATDNGRIAGFGSPSNAENDEIQVTAAVLSGGTNSSFWSSFRNLDTEAVPEPGTAGLWGLMAAGFFAVRRWRSRQTV